MEEEEASSEQEVIGGVDEEDLPTPSTTAEPEVKPEGDVSSSSPASRWKKAGAASKAGAAGENKCGLKCRLAPSSDSGGSSECLF